jgi:NADH-quinone oxidoreductase subunit H
LQGLRALATLSLLLALGWLVAGRGWGTPASLQLIRVSDVAPRDVEPGDRIAIVGDGFPAGRPARVTFRGVLYRPGSPAQNGAEVTVWGNVVAPDRVEVAFDDTAEALFCGAGDRAAHTTFEGNLEVAFASALPGAPPIGGSLAGVTFDVQPGPGADAVDRDRDGGRLLAFLGVHVAPRARGGGLRVDAVDVDSRARTAGITPGDLLETFEGVRVRSVADVIPAPGERDVTVTLRRASFSAPLRRTVSIAGFRSEVPAGWIASALLVSAALAIVFLFAAPTPTSLAMWIQFAVARARERRDPSVRTAMTAAWAVGQDVLPAAGVAALVEVAAFALIALLPFGQFRLASALDIGILFVGSTTALAAAGLVAGRTLGGRARLALHVAWQHTPAMVAVVCGILSAGSLGIQEIARAQGGAPWEWLVFRSPATLMAFVLLVSCMRIDFEGERELADSRWLRAAVRGHRVALAGLTSVLFLGAWSLPGLTFAEQDSRPVLQLFGAACLIAKTLAVLSALALSRWALVPMPLRARSQVTALWVIPAALVTFGAMVLWSSWSPWPEAQVIVSGSLLVTSLLGVAALTHRLRHGLLSPTSSARLSPFL